MRNNEWMWWVGFAILLIFSLGFSAANTLTVCKTQDVFWVEGTQYSCNFFKK